MPNTPFNAMSRAKAQAISVEDISSMDRGALLDAWQVFFTRPTPKGLSQSMLRRFLAHEVQTRSHGGLRKKALTALTRGDDKVPKQTSPTLQPGGRLLRDWNGVTHVVDVTASGFEWRGKPWRSLSAIAREITGAHWSGPRFFGLTKAKS